MRDSQPHERDRPSVADMVGAPRRATTRSRTGFTGLRGVVFALVLAGAALGGPGCAARGPVIAPVTAPGEPVDVGQGVSVLPPAGAGWHVARERATTAHSRVTFMTAPTVADAGRAVRPTTFVAVDVERVRRAELDKQFPTDRAALEHVRQQLAVPATGRFRGVGGGGATWTTLGGAECLRYAEVAEERGNPADPAAVLTIRTEHACCFSPRDRDVGVWIVVSQRWVAGTTPPPPIGPLADDFLRGVTFQPAK